MGNDWYDDPATAWEPACIECGALQRSSCICKEEEASNADSCKCGFKTICRCEDL